MLAVGDMPFTELLAGIKSSHPSEVRSPREGWTSWRIEEIGLISGAHRVRQFSAFGIRDAGLPIKYVIAGTPAESGYICLMCIPDGRVVITISKRLPRQMRSVRSGHSYTRPGK